jgi:hypothetical protein
MLCAICAGLLAVVMASNASMRRRHVLQPLCVKAIRQAAQPARFHAGKGLLGRCTMISHQRGVDGLGTHQRHVERHAGQVKVRLGAVPGAQALKSCAEARYATGCCCLNFASSLFAASSLVCNSTLSFISCCINTCGGCVPVRLFMTCLDSWRRLYCISCRISPALSGLQRTSRPFH